MTGDGTQLSPFVPEDWDELVTAAAMTGVYVQLPAFAEWNMDDYYSEGITAPLVVNCVEIDGNYAKIKNLNVDNNVLRADAIQCNGNLIKNLNLVDIIHSGNSYNYAVIAQGNFYNTRFSGVQEGTSKKFAGSSSVSKFDRCSLNLEGGDIGSVYYMIWKNSEISIVTNTSCNTGILYRCKVTGRVNGGNSLFTIASRVEGYTTENTVVDVYGTGRVVGSSSGSVINSLINKEKWTGRIDPNYTEVTSAQMIDAEYLRSIGFMAGDA